jgi:glycosyltransferase involved in cell wall biosynthesis
MNPHAPEDETPRSRYSDALEAFIAETPIERGPIAAFVAIAAASLPPGSRVADVGAGSAPFRELFSHTEYLTVDRPESLHGDASDFDIAASAEHIPLGDGDLDAIICTQVLEHVSEPAAALAEFSRLLKGGGKLFLTAPLVWEEHEKPFDFFRYTRSGLEHLLQAAGFEHIEISGHTDCFTTLAQLLRNARWSVGADSDQSDEHRRAAFVRLEQMAEDVLDLAPLDARHTFPLGYAVTATRPARREEASHGNGRISRRAPADDKVPILYLAPWVDLGGSDKATVEWFKHIDHSRWAPSIITTQPSPNRWLPDVEPYAEEVWSLPDLMPGSDFPTFILGFIESRGIKIVHLMNSRLGFDLLPDMRCLPDPPIVVVQLHAEEQDRSGYVRYVASRYGGLVDAFSVVSEQLADAMTDYNVPRSRVHVIPLGVDGVSEFNPKHVEPRDLPDGGVPRILWPGRIVAQKDPMLTLDVVGALHARNLRFALHIVGEGDLKDDMLKRAKAMEIDHLLHWHAPSYEMPRWYRSCDLMLMTSVFEGIPYVMYEALAMGLPVVAPALAGNAELMGGGGGRLIDPRDDVDAYADAVQELLLDDHLRDEIGKAARDRMLNERPLSVMGRQHDELYEFLLAHRSANSKATPQDGDDLLPLHGDEPVRLSLPRHEPRERSVAVIMPCYQHGQFLPDALASLYEQTLQPKRIIVVDDASADPETIAVLDHLDQDPRVTVMRLPTNSGPSVARNRALAEVDEHYILPLDADDMMHPRAIEEMVDQLEAAPDTIGFIYPNVRHFGNRNDFYRPPAYNLHMLLRDNFCAAASMFDSRVFDAGIRYSEDIVYGHEDWDLILQLAERGVHGEVAHDATLLYRKQGFSRVDAVAYGPRSFHDDIARRYPRLFRRDRDRIKARWSPTLSLVLADGADGTTEPWPESLAQALVAQTCADFEVLCMGQPGHYCDDVLESGVTYRELRTVEEAVHAARGRFVLVGGARIAQSLGRRTFVEEIVRLFWSNGELKRCVVASLPGRRGPHLSLLTETDASKAMPRAVVWHRELDTSYEVSVDDTACVVEDVILRWQADGKVTWRAE